MYLACTSVAVNVSVCLCVYRLSRILCVCVSCCISVKTYMYAFECRAERARKLMLRDNDYDIFTKSRNHPDVERSIIPMSRPFAT